MNYDKYTGEPIPVETIPPWDVPVQEDGVYRHYQGQYIRVCMASITSVTVQDLFTGKTATVDRADFAATRSSLVLNELFPQNVPVYRLLSTWELVVVLFKYQMGYLWKSFRGLWSLK